MSKDESKDCLAGNLIYECEEALDRGVSLAEIVGAMFITAHEFVEGMRAKEDQKEEEGWL